ncbi:MAG: SDR family oxidoreductase [Paraperlucidibaca sp.]
MNVVVTGAASGIGFALVKRLLGQGHQVCACDINLEAMTALQAYTTCQNQLLIKRLDVRDAAAWQALMSDIVAHWGGVDVLANVAGVLRDNWAHEAAADDVHWQIDINVKGVMFGCQAVLPHMLASGRGHIINIASLAGLSPVPGLSIYSASKFAVRGYTLGIAMELADKGIAVTAVCPDAVQTPMLDIQKGREQAALTFSGPRALTAEEVVDAIVGPVWKKRPMEITLPAWRGATARAASLFPETSAKALGLFRAAGLKRQAAIKAGQDSTQK